VLLATGLAEVKGLFFAYDDVIAAAADGIARLDEHPARLLRIAVHL
jgi:hypothetical protein